jgi:3-hydroxyacyl-[acyl-carrier-protein] dehydratase
MIDTFLLNDFYTIENQTLLSDGKISATILFNANHPIFKGHFEQMPVVPGVCQTQLIKEILQEEINNNLVLSKGTNIKFMAMITPQQHPKVFVEITYKSESDIYSVDAKLFFDSIIFTKFKGEFILA